MKPWDVTGDLGDLNLDVHLQEEEMNTADVLGLIDDRLRRAYPYLPLTLPLPGSMPIVKTGQPIFADITNGQSATLFYRPTGTSGVIRSLSMIVKMTNAGGNAVLPIGLTFNVKYDGESVPSISLPFTSLILAEYPASVADSVVYSLPACELTTPLKYLGGIYYAAFNIRLPIPFTNGIEIYFTTPAGSNHTFLWMNAIYEDGLIGEAWPRLKIERSLATLTTALDGGSFGTTVSLTDPTHVNVIGEPAPVDIAGHSFSAGWTNTSDLYVIQRINDHTLLVPSTDTGGMPFGVPGYWSYYKNHVFLNRPAGEAGMVVFLGVGGKSASGTVKTIFEGNPRFFIDQNPESTLSWTSLEDMFNSAFYFDVPPAKDNRSQEGGLIGIDDVTDRSFNIYKDLTHHPIYYRDGIVGKFPNWLHVSADSAWTVWYYRW